MVEGLNGVALSSPRLQDARSDYVLKPGRAFLKRRTEKFIEEPSCLKE